MNAVRVLSPDSSGRLVQHNVSLSQRGSPPSDAAKCLAAQVLDCFGLDVPEARFQIDSQLNLDAPPCLLACAALLVAGALGIQWQESVVLGVGWNPATKSIDPVQPSGEPRALAELQAGELIVYDRRPVGEPRSLAESIRAIAMELGTPIRVTGVSRLEHVLSATFRGNDWRCMVDATAEQTARAAEHLLRLTLRDKDDLLGPHATASIARAHSQAAITKDGNSRAWCGGSSSLPGTWLVATEVRA